MNEDFSLGKMSADARLTATFKYYEKTEQNGKIVITACLGKGDVPKLNRGYGLDGNELWLSLNNLYQSIRGKDDYTAADDIISWCQQYAHPYYASEDIEEYRWDIEKDTEYWDFSTNILGNFTFDVHIDILDHETTSAVGRGSHFTGSDRNLHPVHRDTSLAGNDLTLDTAALSERSQRHQGKYKN